MGQVRRYHTQVWRRVEHGVEERFYRTYALYVVQEEEVREFMDGILRRRLLEVRADDARRQIERALEQMEKLDLEDWK